MVQIKAHFDGQHVVLPPDVRIARAVEVTVTVPDDAVESASAAPSISHSAWDVIGLHTSTQTVEEMTQELRRDRDAWDDD